MVKRSHNNTRDLNNGESISSRTAVLGGDGAYRAAAARQVSSARNAHLQYFVAPPERLIRLDAAAAERTRARRPAAPSRRVRTTMIVESIRCERRVIAFKPAFYFVCSRSATSVSSLPRSERHVCCFIDRYVTNASYSAIFIEKVVSSDGVTSMFDYIQI